MPTHTDEQHFDYTTVQLYSLVSDIERYPEFLPWVKAVRVTERQPEQLIADVVVSFKHITEQYSCKVSLQPPATASHAGQINVESIKGPFHHLINHWRFEPATPENGTGCEVRFHVDFAFQNRILDKLIGVLFDRATQKMVTAFMQRAEALYSSNPSLP